MSTEYLRMPYSRPSDEDIIKYEQSIMENEVNCTPLVSEALPVMMLCEDYSEGDTFVEKIYVDFSVSTNYIGNIQDV